MRTYRVYISFYSEELGEFDETVYVVNAESLHGARLEAWSRFDDDESMRFASCARQTGVTWDASPVDLRDYMSAQAAWYKHDIAHIDAVSIPNALISRNSEAKDRAEDDRKSLFGGLGAVRDIARDVCGPLGMKQPPDVSEEIERAWNLVGEFDTEGKNDFAKALVKVIELAEKWDTLACVRLAKMFRTGFADLSGEAVNFKHRLGIDGIHPVMRDTSESEHDIMSRWGLARRINRLSALPNFDGRHVIKGSGEAMAFGRKTLVLRKDRSGAERPECTLWTPLHDAGEIGPDHDGEFPAENPVTGERRTFRRDDFLGVLRPEFDRNIDFEALRNTARHAGGTGEGNI
jgi:hypothetical protein